MESNTSVTKQYLNYVSQNILGMIGVSVYILADTFFISRAAGSNGITVLNLALPIYGILFAIGSMIGIGAATRATILKASKNDNYKYFFWNAFFWICIISIPFILFGALSPETVLKLMGGDAEICTLGASYVRTFLVFSPFFMLNYLFLAYVRNDGKPGRAMAASLTGSFFNIGFDYILMFPLHMGLVGAALATGISPVLGILICSNHLFSKNNTMKRQMAMISPRRLFQSVQLGVSAFVGEISSAVTTAVFNFLILGLVGNIGVAAYGIVANMALVAMSIFNGVTQGAQPLISRSYGQGHDTDMKKLLKLAVITAYIFAGILLAVAYGLTDTIISVFNSEQSAPLATYAHTAIRLYFLGYLFAGLNVILTGYFSAVDQPKKAFLASVLRGFAAIIAFAVILSSILGLNGVWLSFLCAEAFTTLVALILLKKK